MALTQLDIMYDFAPKKIHFISRKFAINEKKVIITYPPKSGMTYLLYDHLLKYESSKYLYIDFKDIRVDIINLKKNLPKYILDNDITLLVLDNFDFSFDIPVCDEIIITTNYLKKIEGFSNRFFYPLDFEEFIGFKTHNSVEHIFNLYANYGTIPEIQNKSEANLVRSMQNTILNMVTHEKEIEILKKFALHQSQKITLFGIYNDLKKKIKISKDMFYKSTSDLHEKSILLFVEKYNSPNSPKKVFFIDFTLKNALVYNKDFLKKFENIIYLELFKKKKNIYYAESVDFYLPDEKSALLCAPFLPVNLLKNKIEKRNKYFTKLGVEKVYIITLGNEAQFDINKVHYEVEPFWNWASGL